MKKIHLLVIDPQVDFCDPNGSLYVKGAEKDMERLTAFVDRTGEKLDDIHVTLDSHQELHVAHPIMWRDEKGNQPKPFTILKWDAPNIVGLEFDPGQGMYHPNNHTYRGARLSLHTLQVEYVKSLDKNGRYPLCIWPPHCLIGSKGQTVFPVFFEALQRWSQKEMGTVDFVTKGSNILTEHYSAIVADVPDPADPTTQINVNFLTTVNEADVLLLAGEALSHCVANTGRDACNYFADDSLVRKLVLLEDCSSSVPGFEDKGEEFKREMVKRGMQLARSTDFLI